MGKYRSQHKIWLNPAAVLKSFQGQGRTLESLQDSDLLLLKNGHAEVRKLGIETGSGSDAGAVAIQVTHVAPVSDHGGYASVGSDHWFMTENALAGIEPNEFAPGAAEYQLDISDD